MNYWAVHELCLLTSCCLRHIWRFMSLYLFNLVWSLKVNLPWGFWYCSYQHHVRCPGITVAKHNSNCIGNNRKDQIFTSFYKAPPFTAQQVLWQETAPASLRNIPLEIDCLVWVAFKQLSESQLQLQCTRMQGRWAGVQVEYTAFINPGTLVLPLKTPVTRKKPKQLTTVTDNW